MVESTHEQSRKRPARRLTGRLILALLPVLALLLWGISIWRGLSPDPGAQVTESPVTQEQTAAVPSAAMPDDASGENGVATARRAPAETAPDVAQSPAGLPEPTAPEFDLVRVDRDGSAVVAGRATPGSTVKVLVDGVEMGSAKVSREGTFVAMMDLPEMSAPEEMNLVQQSESGALTTSTSSILVMPRAEKPPQVVVAGRDGARVVQGADDTELAALAPEPAGQPAPRVLADLSLDTIAYDDAGDVVLGGRGSDDQFVRVYVNNKPVETQRIGETGQWKVILSNVDEGLYTLRVDTIDESGEVTARIESPFKREFPQLDDLGTTVTVQPGYTLWYLAERKYGTGYQYVQIFEANRDSIRNPDLIYPGQVFDLPN